MTRAVGLAFALTVAAAAACSIPGVPARAQPCAAVFSEARCAAMHETAASALGVPMSTIVSIEIPPDPTPEVLPNGGVVVQVRGGAAPIVVRATLDDGTTSLVTIGCGGIVDTSDPACTDDPTIRVSSVTISGYGDTPCLDAECTAVATRPPAIGPEAEAAATPILIDRLDVPIDHAGHYEVWIGEGALPNGILTEASFRLIDDWPDGVSISNGYVLLDVRSLEQDGRPFDNLYRHGWREGVERVEAVLVFDVRRFEPGAVVSLADIVVR